MRTCSVVVVVAVLNTFDAAPPKQEAEVDLRKWAEGPIRYISRKDESASFRQLESDDDRALFIERFWSRRDPTPETLFANEYRRMFWERVQEANASFVDSAKPGWMTDRGKIHILYGPPTEIQEDLHLAPKSGPTSGRGVIRWIYEGRPESRMDLDPIVVVPFVRDTSGEFRLTYDPKLASVFFDARKIADDRLGGYERWLEMLGAPMMKSELSVMLDLGRMQEVPPQDRVLLTQVETIESYQTHPLPLGTNRFLHPELGTVVVTTIDLTQTGQRYKPAIVARFQPLDGREPRLLGEDDFRIEERGGRRLGQGRLVLDPGRYTVTVIVADPESASTGLARGSVVVPEPSERMRFSDLVLASELESLPYASLASYDEPFILGPFRVLPRVEQVLRKGESVKLLYEVYGATMPVRVTYQLQGREDDGSWIDLGRPSVAEQAAITHAWELDTGTQWPDGEYRIRVEALDSEGRLVSADAAFTLVTPDPPQPG
jgi:GWxTD domain-containing protein